MNKNKLYIIKGETKSFEPVITKYKLEEVSQTICNGNISEKYYKEVPKSYYGEVTNEDVEHKENKMVNLDDACKWLENKLLCAEDYYPTLEFLSIIEYNSLKELINDFRKAMNE